MMVVCTQNCVFVSIFVCRFADIDVMRAAYINQTNLTTDRVKCEDKTELDDHVHQVKTEPDDDVHQVKTEPDDDVHQVKIEVRTSMTLAGTFSIHTFSSEYLLFFSILLKKKWTVKFMSVN